MKKHLFYYLLSCYSFISLSSTLAVYTTTITNLADGNVVAKEFILLENDDYDTFKKCKNAPTETSNGLFPLRTIMAILLKLLWILLSD